MSGHGRWPGPPVSVGLGGRSTLVKTGFHVKPLALSFQGMMLPLCIGLWVVEFIDLLIKGIRESCSEQVKCLDIVKVISSMSSKMLKFGHIVVHVFSFHLEALLQCCLSTFLFKSINEVLAEGMFHSCPQPDISKGNSIGSNFINKPAVLGLYPLIDMWSLKVGEE